MSSFAQVAVNVPGVKDLFDYSIPAQFAPDLNVGWLVEIPFGKQMVQGVVTAIKDYSDVIELRPIAAVLEDFSVLTCDQMQLADWLSETYFSPISTYLTAMLPPGLSQRSDTLYQLNPAKEISPGSLSALQVRILRTLQFKGALRGRQLDAAFRHVDWRSSTRSLIRQGFLVTKPILPKLNVKRLQLRTIQLSSIKKALEENTDKLGRLGSDAFSRRQAVLRLLADKPDAVDVSWVYASTGASAADLRFLEKNGLVVMDSMETWRDPLANVVPEKTDIPTLTEDQEKAWQLIRKLMDTEDYDQPLLMRGVTGSGKTELYMRAIQKALRAGRQAIVLVPEISLTPQTVARFMSRFPGKVGVIHSKLSAGERYDTWRRARLGEFSIVIGPRSALFTPFPALGVIILDECHDESFYQTEMGPYYHAVEAAIVLGRISKSLVVLGSATPNIETYFRAKHENWALIELSRRILAHEEYLKADQSRSSQRMGKNGEAEDSPTSLPLPEVQIVDMREELKQGNLSIFSRILKSELEHVLSSEQQAILLLNRRGSSSYVFCRECGFTLRCPRCDFALTYHRSSSGLICHTCDYTRKMPEKCPKCSSRRIKQFGIGTEKVETELQAIFPEARILRWDADTSKGKGAEEIILSHFRRHNADILIGTQMLAKGLDLPLVTLVGVVLADVGLNFPDYRTPERVFQLLTQVAGRSGRSALGGRVVIQTFQPSHYAIEKAARHDFFGFYQHEIDQRRRLRYPPFVRLIRFECKHPDNERAKRTAQSLANRLKDLIRTSGDQTLSLDGPLPPYFSKRAGSYRWQIILKGGQPEKIIKDLELGDFVVEVNPPSLL